MLRSRICILTRYFCVLLQLEKLTHFAPPQKKFSSGHLLHIAWICNATWNFFKSHSNSQEWGMGGRYKTTNRGKNEEIAQSTNISRSMGEGIREEWNIYLSIKFWGRSGEIFQLLRTLFPVIRNKMLRFLWNTYVPHQNRTYFWESTCSQSQRLSAPQTTRRPDSLVPPEPPFWRPCM